MVVGVRHDDVVLSVDRDSRWFGELTLHHAKLAELAVVNHLLALYLNNGGK